MPVTIERHDSISLLRLEGDLTVTSAAELKRRLLEAVTAGTELCVDMENVGDFDISVMQLLWCAGRETARRGIKFTIRHTEAAAQTAREAGFEPFPGLATSPKEASQG